MPADLALFKDHLFQSSEEKNSEIYKLSQPYLARKIILLDIGCGNGDYLALLDQQKDQLQAVGIDVSLANIKAAESRHKSSSLEFICGNYFKISLARKFEAIVSNSSLQYQKVDVKKIADDLLDNGFLILYTPYDCFSNRLRNSFRIFMNLLPAAMTDPFIFFVMKLIYGKWSTSDLKSRLVYLRANLYYFIGKKEIAELGRNGLKLEKALYFKKTTSFWQMRHGFFVFKKIS